MKVIYLAGADTIVMECSRIKQTSLVDLVLDDQVYLTMNFSISSEALLSDIVDLRPYQSRNGLIDTVEANNLLDVLKTQNKVILPNNRNCLDTPPWVMFLYTLPTSYGVKFKEVFGDLPMAWILNKIEKQAGDLTVEQVDSLIHFINSIGYNLA